MTGPHRSAYGRAAQWLLLLGTVLGLAAMHTLGHAGMQMGSEVGHSCRTGSAMVADDGMPAAAVTLLMNAVADPCAGDGCHDCGAMTGWSVCAAVLGGLAVAVLFALLLVVRRRSASGSGRSLTAHGTSRSPPIPVTSVLVRSTAVLRI